MTTTMTSLLLSKPSALPKKHRGYNPLGGNELLLVSVRGEINNIWCSRNILIIINVENSCAAKSF